MAGMLCQRQLDGATHTHTHTCTRMYTLSVWNTTEMPFFFDSNCLVAILMWYWRVAEIHGILSFSSQFFALKSVFSCFRVAQNYMQNFLTLHWFAVDCAVHGWWILIIHLISRMVPIRSGIRQHTQMFRWHCLPSHETDQFSEALESSPVRFWELINSAEGNTAALAPSKTASLSSCKSDRSAESGTREKERDVKQEAEGSWKETLSFQLREVTGRGCLKGLCCSHYSSGLAI